MGKRWRLPCLALALLACVDKGTSGPTAQGPADPPVDTAVCATCQQRAGGETADFGAGPSGTTTCSSQVAPLTEEVERAFQLDQLRAFLATPRRVVAEPRDLQAGQPELSGPIEIEFRFEVGEFTYRMGEGCNSVSAPVELTAEVGDGLLSFRAKGSMFKQQGALHAFMYTSANLATATGSYRPNIDTSRPHTGEIEVPIYVYSDQLRGSVIPEVRYYQDQEQLMRWLEGKPPAMPGLASLPMLVALVHLDFPAGDCADHELPLAPEVALELLGGKSPAQLRREVAEHAATVSSVSAVWRDDSMTTVRLELGEAPAGPICADWQNDPADRRFSGSELSLVMPARGRLRTDDGKVDMQIDSLKIALGSEDSALRWATFRSAPPSTPDQKLDGWIRYGSVNGALEVEGIVQELIKVSPNSGTYGDCVAFPIGGEWDTGQCRYRR